MSRHDRNIASGDNPSHFTTRHRLWAGAAILCWLLASCAGPAAPDRGHRVSDRRAERPIFLAASALTEVESRDVYLDGEVLHGLAAGIDETGGRAVVYLRSPDGGRSWSDPVAVSRRTAPPVTARHGNDVQIAAADHRIVAAWPVASRLPGLGHLTTAFSGDGGKTWEPGPNPYGEAGDLDPENFDQGYLDLAADPLGGFHLVWLDDRDETGRHSGVRYSRSTDGGRHWGLPETLDPAGCTCCSLALARDGEGGLAVLYRDHGPHDMALLHTRDRGLSWRRAGPVGAFGWRFQGCPHAGGALTMTGAGMAGAAIDALVWTGRETFQGLYHLRSIDGGQSFGAPIRLGERDAREGDVAALDHRHLIAVWESRGSRIACAESWDGGASWSDREFLSQPGVIARHAHVVATPWGARVFWSEMGPGGRERWAMHPGWMARPRHVANR